MRGRPSQMMAVYRDSLLARTPTPLRAALARMRGAAAVGDEEEEGTRPQTAQQGGRGEGGAPRMGELQCSASQYDLSDSFIATGEGFTCCLLNCILSACITPCMHHALPFLLLSWLPVLLAHACGLPER